jgi:hypothetical protein
MGDISAILLFNKANTIIESAVEDGSPLLLFLPLI